MQVKIYSTKIQPQSFNFGADYKKQASIVYKTLEPEFISEASNLGICKGAILSLIKRLLLSPKFKEFTLEDLYRELKNRFEKILEALKRTSNQTTLEKELRFPAQTIRELLSRRERIMRRDEVCEKYKNGSSIEELMTEYNFCKDTIKQYLKECNITPPSKSQKNSINVINLIKEGVCDEKIAEIQNINRTTVYNIRKRNNLKPNKKLCKIQAIENQIIEDIKKGIDKKEISDKYNISHFVINKIIQKHNLTQIIKFERDQEIIKKLLKKVSPKEIAKEFNLSKSTVIRVAQKYNIPYKIND